MPIIFPKAQEYLKAFYNAKKDFYKILENDFHPRRHRSYAYRNVKEEHRNEVYESAKDFYLFFGNGHDIFDLEVPENFGTPKKALQSLIDYREYLKNDKEEMITLIQHYRNDPDPPLPIETIIKETQEIIDVLDHVLTFDEIIPYLEEQLYNIYIGIPWNTECYYGLNKKDIEKLFEGIRLGKEFVRIDGQKIYISGFSTLLIYNTILAKSGSNKAHLKEIISKAQRFNLNKSKQDFLANFGQNVTDQFDIPDPPEENNSVKPVKNISTTSDRDSKRIFVSHSSADQAIVTDFVEHVLMLGMGVKKSDIFYTSGIGTSIKSGEDFKSRIAKEMQNSRAVVQILSDNYKNSEVCLNEMGAAWALKDIVIPLLVPGYNYDTGFIHANSQQIKLTDRTGLMTVYEDYKAELFDTNVRVDVLSDKINRFVKSLET